MDLLDLYTRASAWTLTKVTEAADRPDAETPCEGWDVRTLLNHLLATEQYFIGAARGEDVSPPAGEPPSILSDDPAEDFRTAREETIEVFGAVGVIDRTGPALGIAFGDQLLHGWDLAKATGQDPIMPNGLPEAAYELIHGAFTDEQRQGVFGPEISVPDDATAQQKLLAYTGREPTVP